MTTQLSPFRDAYATLTVAVYEPLILRWISDWALGTFASTVAWRAHKGAAVARVRGNLPTAMRVGAARRFLAVDPVPEVADTPSPSEFAGSRALLKNLRSRLANVRVAPTVVNRALGWVPPNFDFHGTQTRLLHDMTGAVDAWLKSPQGARLSERLAKAIGDRIYDYLPPGSVEEALSPIGVAHFYRQLYFHLDEGYGPIEQAFTVAPLETLEVLYESVRRQIHEEQIELGTEQVSESATEEKNLEEVSDKVSSLVQRDNSVAMSVNSSGGAAGIWQAGASASANIKASAQNGREESTRRLKEVTTKASERITKSFSLKVRDVTDVTATNLTRRVIRNDSPEPVSYGLRRVLRRVRVKVQDLGPQLVWQVYICEPGAGLARSRFVHFREADEIVVPDVPPGSPPRPRGGTDTGSTSATVYLDTPPGFPVNLAVFPTVEVVVTPGPGRRVTQLAIDSITDLEGGGKDDAAPAPLNGIQWDESWDETSGTYKVKIGVHQGDSAAVNVSYTYGWEPDGQAIADWKAQVDALRADLTERSQQDKFEREKALITEMSKIRPRPANDLRREERYEVMNRMVSQLFARGDDPSYPAPIEIEYFHRFFDIEMMFTYTHPSWWRPRYAPVATGLGRPEYTITADSEPAPMGVSLGWMIQADGDSRRNEFLNSPWVRACLPIRPGREREAIAWLAKHIEGQRGYDPGNGPLAEVLADIDQTRRSQRAVTPTGPNYVAVDSPVGAPSTPLTPQDVYPIIDEFDVTVPTEGFIYDRLTI
ncbi:hypothetical protein [Rhizocola hellebori]|uniref:hypothetical protein n=1 Tax=Rhizocola hellebori TaxID=1392758 RepID=UPI0019420BED|nr:hypothetical protein [Rhizocola hellebori]